MTRRARTVKSLARTSRVVEDDPGGVDEFIGVDKMAAQANSKTLVLAKIAAPVGCGGLGDPEVRSAVGHLRHLDHDPPWLGGRVGYHPKLAAAAHPTEMKCRGRLAL
jgi:hypothetical protein